jgi:Na+-driven multidrug efflux pump
VTFGVIVTVFCQFLSPQLLGLFTEDQAVVELGSQYLRSYVFDCIVAGVHFCFSGFFCAYGFSGISFMQNLVSIILVRVPGAYLASKMFPDTLYPMGMAAPAGSFLSAVICIVVFWVRKKDFLPEQEKREINS